MPIVDGKYEACLSTYFASVADGIEEIRRKVRKSRKVRISNVPSTLLDDLKPMLAGKDVKIVLPDGMAPSAELKCLGDIAVTKARIYVDYKGIEANSGSVTFADRVFNVIWSDQGIHEITSMDYRKCARCLNDTFDVAWRYAEKEH